MSGYRVETDEHPWAQAVLTDGALPLQKILCGCCITPETSLEDPLASPHNWLLAATSAVCLSSRHDTIPSFVRVS